MSTADTWRGIASEEHEDDLSTSAAALLRKRSRGLLGSLLSPYRKQLGVIALLTAANLATWLAEPLLVARAIGAAEDGDTRGIVTYSIAVLVVMLLTLATWSLFLRKSGLVAQQMLFDLRVRVYDKFQRLSLAFHEKYTSGRVVARLTNDIDALGELLRTGIHEVVLSALAVLGIAVILVIKSWQLALVVLGVFPLVILLTWWFRKHSEKAYRAVRNAVALVIVFYNESLGGIRAVQSYRREPRNQGIFEELTERYRDANIRSQRLSATFGPGIRFLGRASAAAVLLAAGYLLGGPETLVVLATFLLFLGRFFGPLQDLSQFYSVFQSASAALEKLSGVLEQESSVPDPDPGISPEYLHGEVRFEGVNFGYGEAPVLRSIDLHVPAGQTVALVGPTGAGKSTTARLIARFYDPIEGRITLDGIDLRDIPDSRLRRAVTMVTQESFLFGGTVADNILFGRPEATREEVEEAARAIGAYEFICKLPDGFDTDVKKRGGRLSSGQRQLIAFARAFLADPSVLILDEATSSLDIPSERLVQHALRTLLADRTAFIIAHRLTTVEIADRVLVIDGGEVVEDGSPEELIGRKGRYQALHAQWLESLAS